MYWYEAKQHLVSVPINQNKILCSYDLRMICLVHISDESTNIRRSQWPHNQSFELHRSLYTSGKHVKMTWNSRTKRKSETSKLFKLLPSIETIPCLAIFLQESVQAMSNYYLNVVWSNFRKVKLFAGPFIVAARHQLPASFVRRKREGVESLLVCFIDKSHLTWSCMVN